MTNILFSMPMDIDFLWETNVIRYGAAVTATTCLAALVLPADSIVTAAASAITGKIAIIDGAVIVLPDLVAMIEKTKPAGDGKGVDHDQGIVMVADPPAPTVTVIVVAEDLVEAVDRIMFLPSRDQMIVTQLVLVEVVEEHQVARIEGKGGGANQILGHRLVHDMVSIAAEVAVTAKAEALDLIENQENSLKAREDGVSRILLLKHVKWLRFCSTSWIAIRLNIKFYKNPK
mmetsp:Transcript_23726/g.33992  ORF Transcript_23726/g.33992 Transcript_23726/m.33992 type:complete len:231 (-) Transcript_23726:113-805(-)